MDWLEICVKDAKESCYINFFCSVPRETGTFCLCLYSAHFFISYSVLVSRACFPLNIS